MDRLVASARVRSGRPASWGERPVCHRLRSRGAHQPRRAALGLAGRPPRARRGLGADDAAGADGRSLRRSRARTASRLYPLSMSGRARNGPGAGSQRVAGRGPLARLESRAWHTAPPDRAGWRDWPSLVDGRRARTDIPAGPARGRTGLRNRSRLQPPERSARGGRIAARQTHLCVRVLAPASRARGYGGLGLFPPEPG